MSTNFRLLRWSIDYYLVYSSHTQHMQWVQLVDATINNRQQVFICEVVDEAILYLPKLKRGRYLTRHKQQRRTSSIGCVQL